jgi:hypothetical protein
MSQPLDWDWANAGAWANICAYTAPTPRQHRADTDAYDRNRTVWDLDITDLE